MGGGVGECLRGVVWIWSAKSARCTGRRRVARGGNVGCSVECDMECTMVTSGGDI